MSKAAANAANTAKKPDRPDFKGSAMILTGQYSPRVHIIGGENKRRNTRGFPTEEKTKGFSWIDTDIAVFTGGSDIHPKFYGEPFSGAGPVNEKRDEYEIDMFHIYDGIPKVGICRGMQLLNILSGGKLVQHVSGHNSWHKITDIWGKEVHTSSVHHQVCIPASSTKVIGWSSDISGDGHKDPEIMLFPDCKGFGVQGHPEYGPDIFREYFFQMLKFFVFPWVNTNTSSKQANTKVVH